VRLIQKEIAIAGRGFRVPINRDDDRLDMLIAVAFSGGETSSFLERLTADLKESVI
jgi:hypothetical protein